MPLHLITLGPPRVLDGFRELPELPSQRTRFALLVYLAVEREVLRESVLPVFWPERDPSRAKHALRQMLYELRQLLGEEWIEVGRDRIVVHADVDAAAFELAVAGGGRDEALALYGGEFLKGFSLDNHSFDGWVDRRRAQLGRTHRRLRRDRIDELLAAGQPELAVPVAQQWVDLDPLEDEASHALIHCLALTGQRVAALQYFEGYERHLAAELQVEPLDETRALVEQIRRGEALGHETGPAGGAVPPKVAASEPAMGAAVPEPGAVPAAVSPTALRDPAGGRRRSRSPRARVVAGVAAVTVLLAGALGFWGDRPRPAAGEPGARVLVMPFVDRTEDPSLASLADMLTEALARNLAQSRPLDVVSATGVALLRQRGVSDDSLRSLLRADYMVSGSVSTGPAGVRVDMELLDGRTGSLLGTDVMERSAAETRVLLEDVLSRTAGILRRRVGSDVEVRRVRSSTRSEEAWRSVLEARALQERVGRLIRYRDIDALEQVLNQADSLLMRAADLDRGWAEPLIMRGWLMERRSFIARVVQSDTAAWRKLLEAGRGLADRAIEREPQEARGYELRGAMFQHLALLPGVREDTVQARLARAEEELRRAMLLDPSSPGGWLRLAEVLNASGRYPAAKNAAERAYQIDRYLPEAPGVVNLLFRTSLELGEDQEAERWCMEGRRQFPGQPPFVYCLLTLHAWAGHVTPDLPLLREEMQAFSESQPPVLQPELQARMELLLAAVYARAGQQDSARAILRRNGTPRSDRAGFWLRAAVLAALGEDREALQSLARFREGGGADSRLVVGSRPFWRFRGMPEYDRLLGS